MLAPIFLSLDILKDLPMVDGAIDLGKLIKLPGGGTHDIYKLNDNPTFLLKVIRNSLGNDKVTLQRRLDELTSKYAKLYEVFGYERCLLETRSIQKVKQTDDIDVKDAIISLVAFDDCFQKNEKFGFNTQAIETIESKLKADPSKYHKMNLSLLGNEASGEAFNQEDFLFFHQSLSPIFERLEKEASLRAVMKDFLVKFKDYYQQTDQLLDFTGQDNVVFYKNSDTWQYKVGSVIKHETGKRAVSTLRAIDGNPEIVDKSFEDWTFIYFVPSWLRMVNAIGAKLGMGQIIENVPISARDSENLSKMYERLPPHTRAINAAEDNDFEKSLDFFKQHAHTEKDHDTRVRHLMCKCYAQAGLPMRPREEIVTFVNLMLDPKNEFPEPYWNEVREVLLKLNEKLEQHGPLDAQTTIKLDATLRKVGHSETPDMPVLLAKAMSDFEAVAVTSKQKEDMIQQQNPVMTSLRLLEAKSAPLQMPAPQDSNKNQPMFGKKMK